MNHRLASLLFAPLLLAACAGIEQQDAGPLPSPTVSPTMADTGADTAADTGASMRGLIPGPVGAPTSVAPRSVDPVAKKEAKPAPDLGKVAKAAAKFAWGIVLDAPRYKRDLTSDLVRGTAVAIDEGTLLASCTGIRKTSRVGLVRKRKYYIARVVAMDSSGDVCVLSAPDAPLNLGLGYRDPLTLEEGEMVLALVVTGANERTELTGRALNSGLLESGRAVTTIELPERVLSAIFVDAEGHLLGIGPSRQHSGPGTAISALSPLLLPRGMSTFALLD